MSSNGYRSSILRRVREQRILHDVTLELTYRCNLDCFYCYNDRAKQGTPLSLNQYRQLLQDLSRMQTMFLMLSGGEPMIHPHFFAIGATARELGFVVRVRTNGHSLSRKIAERVRDEVDPYAVEVSLHGASAEVHDRQTRVAGSFDRLCKNIGISKATGLRVSVVTTPTAWNEQQIDQMFDLCDSLGVPLRFQGPVAPRDNGDTAPLAIQPSEATWDYITERVIQRRLTTGAEENTKDSIKASVSVSVKNKINREQAASCSIGMAGLDIDPFGNVMACMHLQQSAGNIHQQSIEEIWNHSLMFQSARQRAVNAVQQFKGIPIKQFGAPIYCLAVEENCTKGCGQHRSS